jgi:hypothetical protein
MLSVIAAGVTPGAAVSSPPRVITPALAAIAAHAQPTDELDVIVEGPGARAAAAAHAHITKDLALVGGVAATVRASELNRLAGAPGIG